MVRDLHAGTVIFVVALVAAVYAAVLAVPIYMDHLDLQEAVTHAHGRARFLDDDGIRRVVRERTREMGTHYEEDADGNRILAAGLGLADEQIEVFRDPYSSSVRVGVHYQRMVWAWPTHTLLTVVDAGAEKEGDPPLQ